MATVDDYVDIIVLGAGWLSQFLVPLFEKQGIKYALTTTSGRINKTCQGLYDEDEVGIIRFAYQPSPDSAASAQLSQVAAEEDDVQYTRLPTAQTVLITFPLKGAGQSRKLISKYREMHSGSVQTQFIQLGSTGMYKAPTTFAIQDQDSDYEITERARAEDELIEMGGSALVLAGLWGGERLPWNWVKRVAPTREKLGEKTSLHLVHGEDVARACIAYHKRFTGGERWILTDLMVYDWWQILSEWSPQLEQPVDQDGTKTTYAAWVSELLQTRGIQKLPRREHELGRVLDSSKFWNTVRVLPQNYLSKDARALQTTFDRGNKVGHAVSSIDIDPSLLRMRGDSRA